MNDCNILLECHHNIYEIGRTDIVGDQSKNFYGYPNVLPCTASDYALSPLSVTRIIVDGHLNYTNKFPSKFAQGAVIVTSILEVPRSNLGRDTGYLD